MKKKYKVNLLLPIINEEIICAENERDCYDAMIYNIIRFPSLYLNIQIEEIKEDEEMKEDEENEQEENN